ncbi:MULTISPECIES: hypothetical protein [unclassified Microcoleus]|uniref:hypothetical protein n=1 Tax=unclassified Microcoleus TaxID=2642155 RepID=UPI002FD5459D
MLEIDRYVFRFLMFCLCVSAVGVTFASLSIGLKIDGDAPVNLTTLATTLFGFAIALATKVKGS